jgi:CBS domain-containing protein
MLVGELMTPWVFTVPPETTIQEAARKMRAHRIGMVPITRAGEVLGVITDRDIAVRAVADAKHAKLTLVTEIMSSNVVTCRVDHDVEEACSRMQARHIRRIIVVDQNGRLAGVLSVEDIAVRAHKERLTGQTLRGVARAS